MSQSRIILILTLVAVLLASAVPAGAARKDVDVIIHLTNGRKIPGVMLQVTDAFIKIDPDGAISLRTIPAEEISSVEFVDSGEKYDFPFKDGTVPDNLREDPRERKGRRSNGLRPFALSGTLGWTWAQGNYYEGIGSGMGVQLAAHYRFSQDDPYGSSFFLGFSYAHRTPKIDDDRWMLADGDVVVFDGCRVRQFSFEGGTTTKVSGSDSYLYLVTGGSIVNTKITVHLESFGGISSPQVSYSESHGAWRIFAGGVIGLTAKLGIDIRFGFDILVVVSNSEDDYGYADPYYQERDVLGNLLSLEVGLVWEP